MANIRVFHLLSLFLSIFWLATAAPASLSSSLVTKRESDTVKFTINLTWGDHDATGGVVRKAILTNGTIPGPALKMRVGQTVEFLVYNNLPFDTSVHFHGISQRKSPWADGVTGLTQRPIAPGSSYLYKWEADEAGTYFYHAHHKGQMMDGLYGAIFIEADAATERPFKLISDGVEEVEQMMVAETRKQPVFISDWTHFTFAEFYKIQQDANIDNSCTDAIVVNGQGAVHCQSRADIDAFTSPALKSLLQAVNPPQLTNKGCFPPNLSATQGNFTFNLDALPDSAYFTCTPTQGKNAEILVRKTDGWAALSFINSGGFSALKFTIDNHKMWVYEASGLYIKPQKVDQLVVSTGDRYSVLIKLDQQIGSYTINVANNGLNQIISGYASLVYEGSMGPAPGAVSVMNYAGINTATVTKFNDGIISPFKAIKPAPTADVTFFFNVKKQGRPSGAYEWTLSGIHGYNMSRDDDHPLLFQDPNTIPSSDLILKASYGQWVDLIVRVQGPSAQPHPIHKHGNKAFVLGQGAGVFNYSNVAEAVAAMPAGTFNFENPPYRDTFTTTPVSGNSSWMVLRYVADHIGPWALHCHLQTHFSGGMAVVLMDAPERFPSMLAEYKESDAYPQAPSKDKNISETPTSTGRNGPSDGGSPSATTTSSGKLTLSQSTAATSVVPYSGATKPVSFSFLIMFSALATALFGFAW